MRVSTEELYIKMYLFYFPKLLKTEQTLLQKAKKKKKKLSIDINTRVACVVFCCVLFCHAITTKPYTAAYTRQLDELKNDWTCCNRFSISEYLLSFSLSLSSKYTLQSHATYRIKYTYNRHAVYKPIN
jgi:hypothetical protein